MQLIRNLMSIRNSFEFIKITKLNEFWIEIYCLLENKLKTKTYMMVDGTEGLVKIIHNF